VAGHVARVLEEKYTQGFVGEHDDKRLLGAGG
jgi:hypothetical protein